MGLLSQSPSAERAVIVPTGHLLKWVLNDLRMRLQASTALPAHASRLRAIYRAGQSPGDYSVHERTLMRRDVTAPTRMMLPGGAGGIILPCQGDREFATDHPIASGASTGRTRFRGDPKWGPIGSVQKQHGAGWPGGRSAPFPPGRGDSRNSPRRDASHPLTFGPSGPVAAPAMT